jgi:uncharacterized protein (DUF1697 family)
MQYCAFLRAINVGKNNRMKMDALRLLCGEMGFGGVSTYLQTGNVHFEFDGTWEEARDRVEAALVEAGLRSASAAVFERAALEKFVASEPFAKYPADAYRQYVTLYRDSLPGDRLEALRESPNSVSVDDRIVCSAYELGTSTVDVMNSPLAKSIKVPGTTRYWHVLTGFLAAAGTVTK